jgi:hypothetical protein
MRCSRTTIIVSADSTELQWVLNVVSVECGTR